MSTVDPTSKHAFQVCVVKSELRETQIPKDRILEELKRRNYSEEAVFGIKLALEEALTNAVKHGNRCDPCKCVTVKYAISDEEAVISVRDEGEGFVPGEIPDCTAPDRLPLPNGRGIMLMRAYMDTVSYREDGREVLFIKRRNSQTLSNPGQLSPSPVRRTIYFSGRVQGVGFRYAANDIASRYKVAGFVRNLPDGRVELVAEGSAEELDQMQQEIERAMRPYIHSVEETASPATGEFSGFSIAH
jgi:serine/threonine-protein kinase RsbW